MPALKSGASQLGLTLSDPQLKQFETYWRQLSDWNQRANLTSVTGYYEAQVKHFLDSLTVYLAAGHELSSGGRVIDVGAGAGFPGLPLKLAFPSITLHLVESVGKKTAFLEHLVDTLGLVRVTVHTGRAEVLARDPELRDSFDLAVVRGVARLPLLLEYALPFCRTGGQAVALKHGGLDAELDDAAHALEELKGKLAGVIPVAFEGLTDDRVVVAVNKTGPTPDRYPRRTGIPAKRPL